MNKDSYPAEITANENITKQIPEKIHLAYLDGLRGCAALYVVIYHATQNFYLYADSTHLKQLIFILQYGRWAVDIFIVLSGYCLMLPLVEKGAFRGGFVSYVKRRSRRILPPYYAALFLGLVLTSVSLRTFKLQGNLWGLGNLTSHIFLAHNWFKDYATAIDPPMWSVATEWQIYFVFALVLFPLWKRLGPWITIVISLIIGYIPALFVTGDSLTSAHPWYVGLFSFGMAAATVTRSTEEKYKKISERIPWGWLFLFFGVVAVLLYGHLFRYGADEIFVGAASSCGLIILSRAQFLGKRSFFLSFFSNKWCVRLGFFSYSLYLVHYILLIKLSGLINRIPLEALPRMIASLLVFVPISLIVSYLFHLAFERPFMPKIKEVR